MVQFFGTGAHPASCPVGTRASFPGVKWPEHGADNISISALDKNVEDYTSIPPYVFMEWCLVKYRIRLNGMVLS
jgi:hypothetical protein